MEKFTPTIREKRWNLQFEMDLLKKWEEENFYKFNKDSKKPIFSVDCPPPYCSGRWHVGGAAHYAQIDIVARYFRMRGFEVLFPFGVDRNGLPVEVEVEKIYKISAHEVPREQFVKLCREFLDKAEIEIIKIARRMGMSCNLDDYYRTDNPEFRQLTQSSFIELWNKNLIYEDDRPTNWCPVCRTTIADAEIDYQEIETDLYYIQFKLKNEENLVVATTRPELLCSCAAVIFNPDDERYAKLEDQIAVVPLYAKEVPIFPHNYAKPEFGTGLVMVCSFGDYSDIRLFRELNLPSSIAINIDGKMNEKAGPYNGLSVYEARKKIVEDLKKLGLIVKSEKILHRTPECWRSKNPIEFISMREYYLKQLEVSDDLLQIVDLIKFYPAASKQLLLNWISSITTDWPISRRRYYGTEIPIWYCKKCGKPHLPKTGKYYQPWKEKAPFNRCDCGSNEFLGETRTFDTWMDSSGSALYIAGYERDVDLFNKAFPVYLRPQGTDIVRSWLYYSILKAYHLTRKPAFREVRISGMGLDEKGEAMHKSKGNVVYPEPLFQKYGADAFRLWGAMEAKVGSDYRFSENRVEGASKFITKLWNIARFVSSFPQPQEDYELTSLDKMILAELNKLVDACRKGYDYTDAFIPSTAMRNFTWSLFADHYVEAAKSRAYNPNYLFTEKAQHGAWYTLHACLQTLLKLLAPLCPFVSDFIWRELYGKESIHLESFPEKKAELESELIKITEKFIEFNTAIWKYKKDSGIALNESLDLVYAPEELKPLKIDLEAMHKIRDLNFGVAKAELLRIGKDIYVAK